MRWRLGTSNVIMLFTQATAKMVLFAGSCPFETAWWKGGARMMSHCALKMAKIVQINESISLKFIWKKNECSCIDLVQNQIFKFHFYRF